MARVDTTAHLKALFPVFDNAPLTLEAATVADVIAALDRLAPGVAFYICDERGRLRRHVNIFVAGEMIDGP